MVGAEASQGAERGGATAASPIEPEATAVAWASCGESCGALVR